jgi:four helix bundle protein
MQPYARLKVWKKAHALVLRVYAVTKAFPPSEQYGLTAQLRRSTVSIAANLVEGYGRWLDGTFLQHIRIARGSACESAYHLLLASDLGYLDRPTYDELMGDAQEIGAMLTSLAVVVQRRIRRADSGIAYPRGQLRVQK